MKVNQLISILSNINPNAEVFLGANGESFDFETVAATADAFTNGPVKGVRSRVIEDADGDLVDYPAIIIQAD